MASNSAHQRALYRSREEAKANGTLPAWYAAREAEREAETAATMAPFRSAPTVALRGQLGPIGRPSWPADATGYARYMVWGLPIHTPRNAFPRS